MRRGMLAVEAVEDDAEHVAALHLLERRLDLRLDGGALADDEHVRRRRAATRFIASLDASTGRQVEQHVVEPLLELVEHRGERRARRRAPGRRATARLAGRHEAEARVRRSDDDVVERDVVLDGVGEPGRRAASVGSSASADAS